ncbi:MAG: right-handed parallel beta-helix repeat-containing protein [Verrucomicrobia bacterium]|nr:right-handed parallel beta-helix repeat-containing protein [Verrucomicrobiota bacterium]MCH8510272.1 right-handed parallel beta-helix repeat-containing protein [Kiritimatiellia bacterium]
MKTSLRHSPAGFGSLLPIPIIIFMLLTSACRGPQKPSSPQTEDLPPTVSLPEVLQYEPWEFPEARIAHTLVVNATHPDAANENPGTEDRPLANIQAAVERAFRTGEASEGVRILIHPGVYRETVDIVNWNRDAPLLLEGAVGEGGEVILSGSDLFTDWAPSEENPEVFEHVWTFKFGPEPNPWPGLMPMKEGTSFRRELLFVEGAPMRQVYQREGLVEGSYLVDEDAERIYFHPPADIDPRTAKLEVSVRPERRFGAHSKLIRVQGSRNIGFRNLALQHAATLSFNSSAMQFLGTENLLVEDCEIRWNNGQGLALVHHQGQVLRNVVLRRVRANHNGTLGMTGGMTNGLIEDCETSHNNWRGAALGATGWAPCGFKFSGIHRVLIRKHVANDNHASGGWFDDHITHVTLENFTAVNNYRSGISIEAVDGPFLVRGAVLKGNSTGINMFDSVNVQIDSSVILNNTSRGIRIAGSVPLSEEALLEFSEGWRRERLSKRRSPRDITVVRSIIGHTDPDDGSHIYDFGMREHAFEGPDGTETLAVTFETLQLAGNTYALPDARGTQGFKDMRNRTISLEAWQALTEQDADARWDADAVALALQRAVEQTGLSPTGFGSRDQTHGTSNVDELEL